MFFSGIKDAVAEEGYVPGGFEDVGLGAVDVGQSGSGIDRVSIGSAADDETVSLMGFVEALMAGAAYGMIDGLEPAELRKEAPGVCRRLEGGGLFDI